MRKLRFTVVKNATSNIVRGGAGAVVALALPHFLTRALDHDHFAAWALLLQIIAYFGYLDFGLQTALARYLAQAIERDEDDRRDKLVSTAFALLSAAGIFGFAVIGILGWQLPRIFSSLPEALVPQMRGGIVVLAASAALLLPLSTFTAVLLGLHRNEHPALVIGGTRLLGALAVVLASVHTSSLIWLAACVGTFNLLGGIVQAVIAARLLPKMQLRWRHVSRMIAADLGRYCATLSVWSLAMLLISGLDVMIVGYFNFGAVGYYSIAATLIAFVTGLNSSVFSAMLTPVAVLQVRREFDRIERLIVWSTQLNSYAVFAGMLFVFVFGPQLLTYWVGAGYARLSMPILEILMVAQAIRLAGNAYGTVLVAMGLQRYGLYPVLLEGSLNLILSVAGMIWIGARGVAWATLIAAAFALSAQVLFVMRWVTEMQIDRLRFVMQGIARPLLSFAPLFTWLLCRNWLGQQFHTNLIGTTIPAFVALVLSGWLLATGLRQTRRQARI